MHIVEQRRREMNRKTVSVVILTLLLMGMLTSASSIQLIKTGSTIIIVPDDFPTIQEAINYANDEDLIYVKSGTYQENVVVDKTVSLLGENKTTTIIDGGGNGTVVIIDGLAVSLNNFTLQNGGTEIDERTGFPACGVYVWQDNATISNNIVKDNYLGIYLTSSNNMLRNNDIRDNTYNFGVTDYGFHQDIDTSNTVDGKPIYYLVEKTGIRVPTDAGYVAAIDCQGVGVERLTITNNWNGILFVRTSDSVVEDVTIVDNYFGVSLIGSSYNVLRDNNFTNNHYNFGVRGDYLSHYIEDVDMSNTVNRRPIYYLINQTKLRIDPTTIPKPGIGYLALINSTEITIENLTLAHNRQGLLFAFTTNSTIRNVNLRENLQGISFFQSPHNTLTGSAISNSTIGIELYHSDESNLSLNNIENSTRGICILYSRDNVISENSIANSSLDGIYLYLSSHNEIMGNNISRNVWGINIKTASDWAVIEKNEIRDNMVGIWGQSINIPYIIGTSIVENNIINNEYGITISIGWYPAEIFHNNFVNNTFQAYSKFSSFTWDNGYPSGGNYWSNYSGVDFHSGPFQNETGSDGIGDMPYVIDEDDQDRYPLMIPWSPTPPAIWNRTFGGPNNDWPDDVEATSDGGYIIAGSTNSSGAGCYDFWLVKTDMNGDQLWNKTYGGTGDDWAFGIAVPEVISPVDERYIIAGTTNSSGAGDYDVWLVKIDANGNELWNKTYGGVEFDAAYDVEIAPDGGYILTGGTESFTGIADFWLLKIDSNGNELWSRTFNGPGWDIDVAYDVEVTPDGGYILAGVTYLGGALNQAFWLVKTDSNGTKQWDKWFYPGPENINKAFGVAISADGGYAVVGTSFAPMRGEVWLVKTDLNGNPEWNKTYSITGWDAAFDIESTVDKGYIIAGCAGDDFGLIKIDSNGTPQWVKMFAGTNSDRAMDVELAADGGYIVVGDTNSFGTSEYDYDFWLVRFKVHDRVVTGVKPNKNIVSQGYYVSINVTVENQGDYTETFKVTIYANTTAIGNLTASNLAPGNQTTVTFTWTMPFVAKLRHNYTISAYAWPVPNEVDMTDNILIDNWVIITIQGDVNGDGEVDVYDKVLVGAAFGATYNATDGMYWHQPPDFAGPCIYCPHTPNADINGDGAIDIYDKVIVGYHFGETW